MLWNCAAICKPRHVCTGVWAASYFCTNNTTIVPMYKTNTVWIYRDIMATPRDAPTTLTHKQAPHMGYFMTGPKQTWKHHRHVETLSDSSMAKECHVRIIAHVMLLVDHIFTVRCQQHRLLQTDICNALYCLPTVKTPVPCMYNVKCTIWYVW